MEQSSSPRSSSGSQSRRVVLGAVGVALLGGYLLFGRQQAAERDRADEGVQRATDRVVEQVRPEIAKIVRPAGRAVEVIHRGARPTATGGRPIGRGGKGGRSKGGKGKGGKGGAGGRGGNGAKVETNPEIKPEVNLPPITVAPEINLPGTDALPSLP